MPCPQPGIVEMIHHRAASALCNPDTRSRHGPIRRLGDIVIASLLRYNRDLLELELRPTHEDVFQSQPSNMDDYLQQVHESTVVTAIQVWPALAPLQQNAPDSTSMI